tara:strand:+ start:2266 stop:3756 length:1491 start_codon:yes stop_codon:yes gene_type:complete
MCKLKARQLFTNDHPEQENSKPYVKALIVLQAHAQVYYSVLANTSVIWTNAIATAATDGVYVYINNAFFRSLANDSQRAFLLAHEVAHIVLRHPQRGKAFLDRGYFRQVGKDQIAYDSGLFNEAADYVINADLIKHGLEFIPDGLLDSNISRDELVDDVYLKLAKSKDEQKTQPEKSKDNSDDDKDNNGSDSGDQQGNGCADNSSDKDERSDQQGDAESSDQGDESADQADPMAGATKAGLDTHLVPQYDGTEAEQEAAEKHDHERMADSMDQAIDALKASRERGEHNQPAPSKGVGKSSRRSGGTAPVVDWQAELADRVTRIGMGEESNWSRINRRRYVNTGVITPSRKGSFNQMAMTIDISYSVDEVARDAYIAIVADLMDVMRPANGCIVLFTNTKVHEVVEVQSGAELLELEIPQGGGTYMASSVEWLEENGINPDIHMIFTDGEMYQKDYDQCAESGATLILDRHPDFWVRQCIEKSGIDYIVASDDALAA